MMSHNSTGQQQAIRRQYMQHRTSKGKEDDVCELADMDVNNAESKVIRTGFANV